MLVHFPNGNRAKMVQAGDLAELGRVVHELGLPTPAPALALIGSAFLGVDAVIETVDRVVETIAEVVEEGNGMVVDGGTDYGIMSAIGQVRQRRGFTFPLVGVVVEYKVTWPGDERAGDRHPLEPHHSHFVLAPGTISGDSSAYIVGLTGVISEERPSLAVLIGGGQVSRQDVAMSLASGRPVLVLAGTGRLADELAAEPPDSELVTVVPAGDHSKLRLAVQEQLFRR